MNWELAIEKNHEALKRILAMLVAMVAAANGGAEGQLALGDSLLSFRRKAATLQGRIKRKKVNCPRHLLSTPTPTAPPPCPAISTASCSACCVRPKPRHAG